MHSSRICTSSRKATIDCTQPPTRSSSAPTSLTSGPSYGGSADSCVPPLLQNHTAAQVICILLAERLLTAGHYCTPRTKHHHTTLPVFFQRPCARLVKWVNTAALSSFRAAIDYGLACLLNWAQLMIYITYHICHSAFGN